MPIRTSLISAALLSAVICSLGATSIQNLVLSGTVQLEGTGSPISGVRVSIGGARDVGSAVTDAQGNFSISGVSAGTHVLLLSKDGFLQRDGPAVVVAGGNTAVQLSMLRGATVSGRVMDTAGKPLATHTVRIGSTEYVGGRLALSFVTTAQPVVTDDSGNYRAYWLGPGDYFVMVSTSSVAGGRRSTSGRGGPGIPEEFVFYPNVTDFQVAKPLHLSGGNDLEGIDFLGVQPTANRLNVRGIIAVPSDLMEAQPVTGLYIVPDEYSANVDGSSLIAVSPNTMPDHSSRDRRFNIDGVPAGKYTIFPSSGDGMGGYFTKKVQADLRSADSTRPFVVGGGTDIVLERGGDLRIFPVGQKGPAENIVKSLTVTLSPVDNMPRDLMGTGGVGMKRADAEGVLSFRNLPADKYRMEIAGLPAEAYVSEIQIDGTVSASDVIDLTSGSTKKVELAIVLQGATVGGSVVDRSGSTSAGVTVLLVPDRSRVDNWIYYKSTKAQPDGTFAFTGIAPGSYEVVALKSFVPGSDKAPELMRRYEVGAFKLTVADKIPITGVVVQVQE